MKSLMDFMQAQSLRELMDLVNWHNSHCPDHPVLKEDIVQILHEDGTYILLYYK